MKNLIRLLILLSSIFLITNSYAQTELLKPAPEGKHYKVIQFYIGDKEHARVILIDDGFIKQAINQLKKSFIAQLGSGFISLTALGGLVKSFLVYRRKLLHAPPPGNSNETA